MAETKLGALLFDLIVDKDGKFAAALSKAHAQAKNAGKSMQDALGGLKGLVAGVAVEEVVRNSLKAYEEGAKAVDNLRAALSRTGDATDATIAKLTDYSTTIMKMTVLDDEAITNAMAYGKSLGMQTSFLGTATTAAVGLSQRLGIDLNKSMLMIQKASIGNVAALQKLGVQFSATASKEEKLDAVLRYGNEGFKQAVEYANTASGEMQSFKVMIGEAAEKLGAVLIPMLKAFIVFATPILEWFASVPAAVVGGIIAFGGVIYILANAQKWIHAIVKGWEAMTAAISAAKAAAGEWWAAGLAVAAAAGVLAYFAIKEQEADKNAQMLTDKMGTLGGFMDKVATSTENANKAIVQMKDSAKSIAEAPENPYLKQAADLKDIIDRTKEATKAEIDRKRALVGSIDILDINKKAIEGGLRERYNVFPVNQGDLAPGMDRAGLFGLRSSIPTRKQYEEARATQQGKQLATEYTMQQILMYLKDERYSNTTQWQGA